MPYFVYAVHPPARIGQGGPLGQLGQLEPLGEHDAFAAASAQAKQLRAAQAAGDSTRIRVMFAATALEAEELLLQVRQPHPPGDA